MCGERSTGQEVHLERPYEPLQIARLNAECRFGIHFPKQPMQPRDAAPLGGRLEPPPQGGVTARTGKQAPRQRPKIEPGPSGDDRQAPARVDLADRSGGIVRVLRGGVVVGRFGDVDQVVRNAAPIGLRDLVGADIEPTVHRGRVAVDDLAAKPLRKRQRQRALPRGRGPQHRDDERVHRTRTTT